MDLPKKQKSKLPPKPQGGGAAARLRQFEIQRGEIPSLPEPEEELIAEQGSLGYPPSTEKAETSTEQRDAPEIPTGKNTSARKSPLQKGRH